MIEKITIMRCDVCGKEMKSANGRMDFTWSPHDWAGNGAPAGIILHEICEDCARAINNSITKTCSEIQHKN